MLSHYIIVKLPEARVSFPDRNVSAVCRRPRCRRRKLFAYFFCLFLSVPTGDGTPISRMREICSTTGPPRRSKLDRIMLFLTKWHQMIKYTNASNKKETFFHFLSLKHNGVYIMFDFKHKY